MNYAGGKGELRTSGFLLVSFSTKPFWTGPALSEREYRYGQKQAQYVSSLDTIYGHDFNGEPPQQWLVDMNPRPNDVHQRVAHQNSHPYGKGPHEARTARRARLRRLAAWSWKSPLIQILPVFIITGSLGRARILKPKLMDFIDWLGLAWFGFIV